MPARPAISSAPPPAQNWHDVEQLVETLATFAQSDISLPAFATALLEHAQQALGASGGAVWSLTEEPTARLITQRNWPARLLSEPTQQEARPVEQAEGWLLGRHIEVDHRATLSIELLFANDRSAHQWEDARRLLGVFGEIATDYLRRQELRELRQRDGRTRELGRLLAQLHQSLDLRTTVYAIANDGRQWLGADRISLILWRKGRASVAAVSGLDEVDSQADDMLRLTDLTAAVAKTQEPLLWSSTCNAERLPQVEAALQAYLDCAHAACLYAVPLGAPAAQPSAVLVAEWFHERDSADASRQNTHVLATHASLALQRALEHQLPLLWVFVALGKLRDQLQQRAILWPSLAAIVALLLLCLWLIPAQLMIAAPGTLLPEARRHLFAPHDGVVQQILVDPEAEVVKGQELLRLRDRQLEFELAKVRGELDTIQSRLSTIRAKRASRPKPSDSQEDPQQLAAEEEQLRQKAAGLAQQLAILTDTQKSLMVTSPMNGQLLTWDAQDLLADRPVKQGQQLLTVADTSGPWIVELQVADADIGHLLAARQNSHGDLRVSFLLATDPSTTHHGSVIRIATSSNTSDSKSPTTLVLVKPAEPIAGVRSGAGVYARVNCGTHSLGYVWLHDLLDAIRSRLLF